MEQQRIEKLEDDMSDVKTRLAVAESSIKDIKEDLSSIKNNTTWIIRLIIGVIVMGLITMLMKGGV